MVNILESFDILDEIVNYLDNSTIYALSQTNQKIRMLLRNILYACTKCFTTGYLCLKQRCYCEQEICISDGLIVRISVDFIRGDNRRKVRDRTTNYVCEECCRCYRCKRQLDFTISDNGLIFKYAECRICRLKYCRSAQCRKYTFAKCGQCYKGSCRSCTFYCMDCECELCIICILESPDDHKFSDLDGERIKALKERTIVSTIKYN